MGDGFDNVGSNSGNLAAVRPIGLVNFKIRDVKTGEIIEQCQVKNNVLNVGRRALLQALSSSSAGSATYFNSCKIGNGGATLNGSTYVEKSVSRDRDGLFGTKLDEIAVVSSVLTESTGMPYAIVSSILGSESPANGSQVNEIGLTLKNGTMYALVTWPGTYKTSSIEIILDWLVYFL